MKLIFSQQQTDHRPRHFMLLGRFVAPHETPERLDALVAALTAAGLERASPDDTGLEAILRVHSEPYVEFLRTAFSRWRELPDAGPEVLPNVHAYRGAAPDFARVQPVPCTGVVGQTGWFVGDLNCAIGEGTWHAAYASAQAVVAGVRSLIAGAPSAYALCRPPGHHAYTDRASGFCFLNNAAIAAQQLRNRFSRVAIIDFDTHHGDGTQAIFYGRGDVFFGSIHTDPPGYYPYYSGYAHERGHGSGEGATLNLPLPFGSEDDAFVDGCLVLADAARAHGSEALVVSAGWDAHRDDPLSRLRVTTDAFARVGKILADLRLPTLIVQEGGYSLAASAEAAPHFVESFLARHSLG